jgi:hypothetical protein
MKSKPVTILLPNHFIMRREDLNSLFDTLPDSTQSALWVAYTNHWIEEAQEQPEGIIAHALVHAIIVDKLINAVFHDQPLNNEQVAQSAALMLSSFRLPSLSPEEIDSLTKEFLHVIEQHSKGERITLDELSPWANAMSFRHRQELENIQNN